MGECEVELNESKFDFSGVKTSEDMRKVVESTPLTGYCSADSDAFGCHHVLKNGGYDSKNSICKD